MRSMLIGWDKDGNVRRAVTEMVAFDERGEVAGFVDFEAHELAGGSMTDIVVFGAVAVDELPTLPHERFPPLGPEPGARPLRRVYLMPERRGYINVGEQWVPDPDPPIVGAGTWPEFLEDVRGFKVDLRPGAKGGTPKVRALVHKESGHQRKRADLEAEVGRRVAASKAAAEAKRAQMRGRPGVKAHGPGSPDRIKPEPVDVGDLFGGPDAPIKVDAQGRTVTDRRPRRVIRTVLPVASESRAIDVSGEREPAETSRDPSVP